MEAMLFSPACRSLEVLRLDEQVALTAEETGSLSRYLAAGRGWKLRELRMGHLGRGMEEGEWGEDIFPLIHALTSPLTSSSFLQVLELRGCRLRGEPIECLARVLSPFFSFSSSAVPCSSPAGSNLFPSLLERRLPLCDLEAGDVRTLLQGLKVEAGEEEGRGKGGGGDGERGGEKGGGGGSGKALRVLELSGNELGQEGCVALWEGLSEGACPAFVELGLVQVRMKDAAMQRGLVEAILRRKREGGRKGRGRGREGGACPCLATLEVLRLSNSFLTSEASTFLAAALHSPARRAEDDLVVREGGREGRRGDALQRLRGLYLDRARNDEYDYFGNDGIHALVYGRRSFEVGRGDEEVEGGHGRGVLTALPRLEVLSLEHNGVGRKGMEVLVEHLEADMDWLNKGWKLARSNRTRRTKKGGKGGREGGRKGGEGKEDTLLTAVPVIKEGGRERQGRGKEGKDEEEEEEEEEIWEEKEIPKGLRTPRLNLLRLGDLPSEKTKRALGHLVTVVEDRNSGVRAWRKALRLQKMQKQTKLKLGLEQNEEEPPEWFANECRLDLVGEVG